MSNTLATDMEDLRITDNGTSYTPISTTSSQTQESKSQDPESQDTSELQTTIDSLIQRCQTLHSEVQTYCTATDALQTRHRTSPAVEYRGLRNEIKNELTFLTKLLNKNISPKQKQHYIVSSNIVYYESLWDAAKRTSGLLSFRKYFFWNRVGEGHKGRGVKGLSLSKGAQTKGKSAALVDIVAREGREWVRVSSISEKRLMFDLAKMGWQNDSDSDEDEDEEMGDAPSQSQPQSQSKESGNWEDEDDEDQIDIVKSARELARAARANPIRGRPPTVHIVLTRISSGQSPVVDSVLQKLRQTGAIIHCANELTPPPPLSTVLPNLLVDPSRDLSETLNIDCTILLALVSDISHRKCEILDWYPVEVKGQIREEEKEKLLTTHLYPAIGSHPMVCTREAADQMNLIVNTLATDTEKARCDILVAQGSYVDKSPSELVESWTELSDHPIPEGFKLPIRVVSTSQESYAGLPAVADKIAQELSPLNKAIFFYGWSQGLTTLSSNRARARQIETLINEEGLEDGEAGPHIWLCGESRSLIAKQGRRK